LTNKSIIESKENLQLNSLNINILFEKLEASDINKIFDKICDIENIDLIKKTKVCRLFNAVNNALSYMWNQREITHVTIDLFKSYLELTQLVKLIKVRRDFPSPLRSSLMVVVNELPDYDEQAPKQGADTIRSYYILSETINVLLSNINWEKLLKDIEIKEN
jgi:hypothetical protein